MAAAVTIAAPMPMATHGLASTLLRALLNAIIITPNSMSWLPMFFRKEANCERIAFINPPKPRSPVIIWPMASAAATMLSARNFDT